MNARKILILDDEAVILDLLRRLLVGNSYELDLAESLSEARGFLASDPRYALLIADLRLPDGRGDDFIMEFQAANPPGKVLVISGHPELSHDIPHLEARGMGGLLKPFKRKELSREMDRLLGMEGPA